MNTHPGIPHLPRLRTLCNYLTTLYMSKLIIWLQILQFSSLAHAYRIENHAKVARSQYLSFLTAYSTWWWRASYAVTLLLNLLILSCSESILIVDGATGVYCSRFKNMARFLLGVFHLLFWTLSTAEFFFIELPILVNRHNTGIKVSSTAIMQAGNRQASSSTSINASDNNFASSLLRKLSHTTGGLASIPRC